MSLANGKRRYCCLPQIIQEPLPDAYHKAKTPKLPSSLVPRMMARAQNLKLSQWQPLSSLSLTLYKEINQSSETVEGSSHIPKLRNMTEQVHGNLYTL